MTLNELYRQTKLKLKKAGIDSPAFDALCLFEYSLNLNRHTLIIHGNDEAEQEDIEKINDLSKRRANGEPLQYILGKWSFMDSELFVGPGVLIPREDTSCVVTTALNRLKNKKNLAIADLCSGTGAIAISLAKTLNCHVTATELYDNAFSYLKKNIQHNHVKNVTAVKADVLNDYNIFSDCSLDLIISNPPYIRHDEIPTLQREVLMEPQSALDGGDDGLLFYKIIIKNWSCKLKRGGMLCFEIGEGQYENVKHMMLSEGYSDIGFALDLGSTKRCIYGFLAPTL